MSIDFGSPTPLWRQLAELLRAEMAEGGKLPPGSRVPSETTLVQEHGLARGTVRKAMAALENDGLIIRVQGRGSYVRAD